MKNIKEVIDNGIIRCFHDNIYLGMGQSAPVALKVILTVVLVISAIIRCAIDFLLANN